VVVYTRVQTPLFCGHLSKAGTLPLTNGTFRDLRINWLIVGINPHFKHTNLVIIHNV